MSEAPRTDAVHASVIDGENSGEGVDAYAVMMLHANTLEAQNATLQRELAELRGLLDRASATFTVIRSGLGTEVPDSLMDDIDAALARLAAAATGEKG